MHPTLHAWSLASLTVAEQQRVADLALSLAEASRSGLARQPLRGRNLAVLSEEPSCNGSTLISRAANALGAMVTHIRPSTALNASVHGPDAVLSLLGRLYDAIDCYGVDPDVVDRLVLTTGRPVFNALSEQREASADTRVPDEFALQALLVSALTSR